MYAVIKTGGKQYRVQPGDLLVVEKLDGEPGAAVAFGDVLLLGDGEAVTVGAPLVAGASVSATLVETRKGEKVKIFKKIRRQNYRRTRGHRQEESVLRVTGILADGKETKWDGEVSLVTKAELDARARGLDFATLNVSKKALKIAAKARAKADKVATPAAAKAASPKATQPKGETKAEAAPAPDAKPATPSAKQAAPKKAAAPKAAAPKADATEKKATAPKKAAAPKKDKSAK